MKIRRGTLDESRSHTEQTPLVPPDLLFQLAYGAALGFLIFFVPLALIDVLKLWWLFGLDEMHYLQTCWDLIRLIFALIGGR